MDDALGREVGARIRDEMFRHGVSQKRLAPVLGLDQSTLSKKLRGTTPFWFAEVFTAAEYLGVPLDRLAPPVPGPDDDRPKPAGVPATGIEPVAFCSEVKGLRRLGVVPSTDPAPNRRAA